MTFRFVFWDILPCKIIVDRRFRGACCLHHQGNEAARKCETSVDIYLTTRQYIPEDSKISSLHILTARLLTRSEMDCTCPTRASEDISHRLCLHTFRKRDARIQSTFLQNDFPFFVFFQLWLLSSRSISSDAIKCDQYEIQHAIGKQLQAYDILNRRHQGRDIFRDGNRGKDNIKMYLK
jgi:hypothetical protein